MLEQRHVRGATCPLLGDVKVTSALAFDIGVYLVVVGLVLMVFEAFGDDPDASDADTSADRGGAVERGAVT